MNEESKKIEKSEQEANQEVKPAELAEQELDKVAGGAGWKPPKAGQIDKGGKAW